MATIPQEWLDFIAPVVARTGQQRFWLAVHDDRATLRTIAKRVRLRRQRQLLDRAAQGERRSPDHM